MFTLRICNDKTKSENLFEVQGAEFYEQPFIVENERQHDPGLIVRYENGGRTHYGRNDNDTRAYLMNRHGTTVANWRF